MAEFKILLHKNAKNVQQIEDYWKRRLKALEQRNGSGLLMADLRYLFETGRADEKIFTVADEKPSHWGEPQARATRARLEDGDQTLWSRIYLPEGETNVQEPKAQESRGNGTRKGNQRRRPRRAQ